MPARFGISFMHIRHFLLYFIFIKPIILVIYIPNKSKNYKK